MIVMLQSKTKSKLNEELIASGYIGNFQFYQQIYDLNFKVAEKF